MNTTVGTIKFQTKQNLAEELGLTRRQIGRYCVAANKHQDFWIDGNYRALTEYQQWFLKKMYGLIQAKVGLSIPSLGRSFEDTNSDKHKEFSRDAFNQSQTT